jgi:hypothetical protein
MNVEIDTETSIFLFWKYLFRNLGILSLQCRLNMEVAKVYLGSMARDLHCCTHWLRPRSLPQTLGLGLVLRGRYWGQQR